MKTINYAMRSHPTESGIMWTAWNATEDTDAYHDSLAAGVSLHSGIELRVAASVQEAEEILRAAVGSKCALVKSPITSGSLKSKANRDLKRKLHIPYATYQRCIACGKPRPGHFCKGYVAMNDPPETVVFDSGSEKTGMNTCGLGGCTALIVVCQKGLSQPSYQMTMVHTPYPNVIQTFLDDIAKHRSYLIPRLLIVRSPGKFEKKPESQYWCMAVKGDVARMVNHLEGIVHGLEVVMQPYNLDVDFDDKRNPYIWEIAVNVAVAPSDDSVHVNYTQCQPTQKLWSAPMLTHA
jgi:hypothetical protein